VPSPSTNSSIQSVIRLASPRLHVAALELTPSLFSVGSMLSYTSYIHITISTLHCSLYMLTTFASRSSSDPSSDTFLTSSSHLVQGLPLSLPPSTIDSYTLSVNQSPLIRSTCPNHFKTFQSSLVTHFHTNSVTHFSILVTLHIFCERFKIQNHFVLLSMAHLYECIAGHPGEQRNPLFSHHDIVAIR